MDPQQTPTPNTNPESTPAPIEPPPPAKVPGEPPQPDAQTPSGPQSQPPTSGDKKKGVILAIVAAIIVVAVIVAAMMLMGDKSADKNKSSNKNGISTSNGAAQSDNGTSGTYTHKEGKFSVAKPVGWKEGKPLELPGVSSVRFQPEGASETDLSTILVAAYPKPEGKSLAEIVDAGKKVVENYPGFALLQSRKFKRDGNEAVYLEAKYTINGRELRQSQLAVAKGGKFYTVTATLYESEWSKNLPMITAMQDSLKVQ